MRGEGYSLMRGGLVHRLLAAIGALQRSRGLSRWLALALLMVTFLPLALLSAGDGELLHADHGVALLEDYATLARFLLALPLLVLLAPRCDDLLRGAVRQLMHSSLLPPHRQAALTDVFRHMRRLRDSLLPELLCAVLALSPLLLPAGFLTARLWPLGWTTQAPGVASAAGSWLIHVSMPLFRFVELLWLWRFGMWCYLLWRLARSRMVLHAAHPDGAGGIGFLGVAQERFAVLGLANGILLAAQCANQIRHLGESISGMAHLLIGYVLLATALTLAPLLLLAPLMMRSKRHALLRYDALGNRAARDFDRRWHRGQTVDDDQSLLDSPAPSAVADFTGVYATIQAMPPVPVNRWTIVRVALYAAAPLLPLALFAFSADELLHKLLSLVV